MTELEKALEWARQTAEMPPPSIVSEYMDYFTIITLAAAYRAEKERADKWKDDALITSRLCEAEKERADFMERRLNQLQSVQKLMRDPERKMVCDILANGITYEKSSTVPGAPGDAHPVYPNHTPVPRLEGTWPS